MFFGDSRHKNFVPADWRFPVFNHKFLNALAEIGLQALVILDVVGLHELLNFGIGVPFFTVHLVAADMKILVRETAWPFPR